MNKKYLYSLFISSFCIGSLCAQTFTYHLDGTTSTPDNDTKVYLKTLNESKSELVTLDSTIIKNGHFAFEEKLSDPKKIRFIQVDNANNDPSLFIPEEGNIKLDITNKTSKLSGTKENDELQVFLTNELDLNSEANKVIMSFDSDIDSDEAMQKLDPITNKLKAHRFSYIQENIDSDLGEFFLLSSLEVLPADSLLLLMKKTRLTFQNSELGKKLTDYYEPQLARIAGKKFKDIELADFDGKKVKLSDYAGKGKVVLVDFWASWCGPCIKEMPTMVELYNQYKDKDFEIVGVSLDDKKEAWINAMNKFNISWPQMSDLKGWKSSVVKSYGVYSIPLTLLIDKEGIVVGENLRGKQLTDKLNELLR